MGDGGQNLQTFCNKTKSPRNVTYRMETVVNTVVLCIWKLLKE